MSFICLLLVFLGILLETTLYPLPLGLVGLVLAFATGGIGGREGIGLAALVGLVLDVWLLRPVGVTAAYFTAVLVLLRLYSRKMEVSRLRYLLPFTGITTGFYSWHVYTKWLPQVISVIVIVAAVSILFDRKKKG